MADPHDSELPLDEADDATTSSSAKKPWLPVWLRYVLALVILAAIGFLLFMRGTDMLTKPFVADQLSAIAQDVSAHAAAMGDKAELTYGELVMKGSAFNKKAHIRDLALSYEMQLPFGKKVAHRFTTASALVSPHQMADGVYEVVFADPITIEREGYAPITLTYPEPPIYVVGVEQGAETSMQVGRLQLPAELLFTAQGTDSEAATAVTMRYDANPIIEHRKQANGARDVSISFNNITLNSSAEAGQMKIGELKLASSSAPKSEFEQQFTNQVTLGDVSTPSTSSDGVARSLRFVMDVAGTHSIGHKDVDMKVDTFTLTGHDFSLDVVGTLHRKSSDTMPFGRIDVTLDGVDAIRQLDLLGSDNEVLFDTLINAIAGVGTSVAKDTQFTIQREAGGNFHLGQATFEQLVGLFVTHRLTQGDAKIIPLPKSSDSPMLEVPAIKPVADDAPSTSTQPSKTVIEAIEEVKKPATPSKLLKSDEHQAEPKVLKIDPESKQLKLSQQPSETVQKMVDEAMPTIEPLQMPEPKILTVPLQDAP